MTYDAKTENGIPYISALYARNFDYEMVITDLDGLAPARKKLLKGGGTVTQYSIGSRSLTRESLSAAELLALWNNLMAKKKQLETGSAPRKAVGVVLRDW